jgi:ElaB/YqjD/DUF883 family membrane-anchored ribosome-binding protein
MGGDNKLDMDDLKHRAAQSGSDVNVLAAQVVEAMQRAVEDMSRLLSVHASDAGARLSKAGRAATDQLGDIAENAKNLGDARLDDLSVVVRKNPLAWLAAAVGIGLIIGLWQNRDSRP